MKFRHMIFCSDCYGKFTPDEFNQHDCVSVSGGEMIICAKCGKEMQYWGIFFKHIIGQMYTDWRCSCGYETAIAKLEEE